jgi:hypothetical protein
VQKTPIGPQKARIGLEKARIGLEKARIGLHKGAYRTAQRTSQSAEKRGWPAEDTGRFTGDNGSPAEKQKQSIKLRDQSFGDRQVTQKTDTPGNETNLRVYNPDEIGSPS